jgi:cytochrome b561
MTIRKKQARTRTAQFSTTAKWFHWLIAFLMMSILSVAFSFAFLSQADRAEAIPVHVSLGLIVLLLTLLRLAWRAVYPPPPHPAESPGWVKTGAKLGHFLLYALIFWQAFLGLLMAASSPVSIRFFNGFNISALAPGDASVREALLPLHAAGAWLFALVLFGHVAGALYHHFALKDDVLVRMLPFSGLAQRMADKDSRPAWRMPSAHLTNWPKGRVNDEFKAL